MIMVIDLNGGIITVTIRKDIINITKRGITSTIKVMEEIEEDINIIRGLYIPLLCYDIMIISDCLDRFSNGNRGI